MRFRILLPGLLLASLMASAAEAPTVAEARQFLDEVNAELAAQARCTGVRFTEMRRPASA